MVLMGGRIYIGHTSGDPERGEEAPGVLSIIRGTEVLTTVSTHGRGPSYITVDEERGYIYVSNADSHSVAVFGFEEEDKVSPSLWQQFFPLIQK